MRYVVVSVEDFDKSIKFGPLELEDPSEYIPDEGTKLISEEEALASGYRYAEGGGAGFAPGDDDHDHDHGSNGRGKKHGHDKHGDKHDK